ncbi:MFS transporter [Ruania albidiflava]|uniref:MFS transporter n=1 Tax=Ruania albidiflava TaxID=366586 RepID=UPI000417C023|nr:MFS transporter [Ruania albidiflava]
MREKLWSRGFLVAVAVGFCISCVFYMLITIMALYAAQEFDAGDAAAGLASSAFVIGAVGARLVAGAASDRFGRRRVLRIALVVFTLAAVAYFAADSLGTLIAVRVVHGMSFGTAHTSISAIAQSLIPASRRAEGTGYFGASSTLATAVGPFIAVLLLSDHGGPGLFVTAVAGGLLALLGALVLGSRQQPEPPTQRATARRRSLHLAALLEPRAVPISLFAATTGIAYSGVLAYLNSYAEELDLSAAAAVFFAVYGVVVLALRLPIGRFQDSRGDNPVLYPAIAALAASLALLAVARTPAMLLLAAGLLGLGWGTVLSAGQAIAVASAPIQNVGKVIATYFVLLDTAVGLGPIVLGLLAGATDFATMYAVLAGLTVVSAVVYHYAHGRRSAPALRQARPAQGEPVLPRRLRRRAGPQESSRP